jgi:predicted acyltransferase
MGFEQAQKLVTKQAPAAERLVSLDAYRGFVMLAMVSAGLGMGHLLADPTWGWLADQFSHRAWEGCTFWDLIQPSFMFIVGVAMPFSFARRRQQGESWGGQFAHVLRRALLLVLVGVFLDSFGRSGVTVQFIRVLQQIAIGYVIAFFVLELRPLGQAAVAAGLLAAHTAAFALYGYFAGVPAWGRDVNLGYQVDVFLHTHLMAWANGLHQALFHTDTSLSLWPPSSGGYAVLNALSAAATIVLGVLCGELMRGDRKPAVRLAVLLAAGLGLLAAGAALSPAVPMVKRIWTSSFGLWAAGWTFLMILGFYLVIDVLRLRRWAFPLVVVGMNSIAIYVAAGTLKGPVQAALKPFTSPYLSSLPAAGPVVLAVLTSAVLWLFCYWLYRQRIFFRL